MTRVSDLLENIDDPEEFTRRYDEAAGACMAAILQDRDLTQDEAAAVLGVSTRQFRRLVNGEVSFTVPQLQLLARKTKTTAAAILEFIEEWPAKTDVLTKRGKEK
jgi:transcriptional regulator with XRE-family HTH domain